MAARVTQGVAAEGHTAVPGNALGHASDRGPRHCSGPCPGRRERIEGHCAVPGSALGRRASSREGQLGPTLSARREMLLS
jgi:hypothetical protein